MDTRRAPSPRYLRSAADLRYPFPSASPQRAAELEARALDWARAQRLLDGEGPGRFAAVGVGLLTALTYPGAAPERQAQLAQFFGWIFLQDDSFDEREDAQSRGRLERHVEDCVRALAGEAPPPRACHRLRALADLRRRLAETLAPAELERFRRSMEAYLRGGVLAEHALRRAGRRPSASAYLRARRYSVCLLPPLELAGWAHGVETAPAVAATPALARLRWRAALIAALANDLFSYRKEQRQGDPNNLVLVRMSEGLPEALAADRVAAEHDALVARFQQESRALERAGADRALAFHVEACRRWLVGALDWQRRSLRYAEPADASARPPVQAA